MVSVFLQLHANFPTISTVVGKKISYAQVNMYMQSKHVNM